MKSTLVLLTTASDGELTVTEPVILLGGPVTLCGDGD